MSPRKSPTQQTTTTPKRQQKPKAEGSNSSALVPAKPVLDAEIVEAPSTPLTPEEATRLAELEDTVDTSLLSL